MRTTMHSQYKTGSKAKHNILLLQLDDFNHANNKFVKCASVELLLRPTYGNFNEHQIKCTRPPPNTNELHGQQRPIKTATTTHCIKTHAHAHAHAHAHEHAHTHTQTHTHTHTHARKHTYTDTPHTHAPLCKYTRVYVYASMYVCLRGCTQPTTHMHLVVYAEMHNSPNNPLIGGSFLELNAGGIGRKCPTKAPLGPNICIRGGPITCITRRCGFRRTKISTSTRLLHKSSPRLPT